MTDQKDNSPKTAYALFATFLFRLRESRGIRSEQMAIFLGIGLGEYQKFEDGISLPDNQQMMEMARIFKVPLAKFKEINLYARRKSFKEETPLEGAMAFSDQMTEAITHVKKNYKEKTGRSLTEAQGRIFGSLKRELYKNFFPPLLPFNLLLILDSIANKEGSLKYLHEMRDFVLEGESLAGFIARDYILGGFIFHSANLFFHHDSPSSNIQDSLNRLTIVEFKQLLLIGAAKSGVYTIEQELGVLQQHCEFVSLSVLTIREFKDHLPKNINYNHLEMAAALQGAGYHFLFTTLQPTVSITGSDNKAADGIAYESLDQDLFDCILFDVHPVVAAMVSANWHFPKEVIEILLSHHNNPPKDVSPECALLKVINFLVDCDFPNMAKEELKDILMAYPQIDIPLEVFFNIIVKLNKMKAKLIERTSVLAVGASKNVDGYFKEKMNQFSETGLFTKNLSSRHRNDYRFDAQFQKVLSTACMVLFDDLRNDELIFATPEAGMNDILANHKLFLIRSAYAQKQDIQSIAFQFKMTENEIRELLHLR